jgi:hypothetical protein
VATAQILLDNVVELAVCEVEALLKAPMIDCAIFCALKSLAPGLPTSIFDLLLPVMRVEQVGLRDDVRDDE